VLLPEAVDILRRAGARVDADGQQVRIGRDIVEAALASAPRALFVAVQACSVYEVAASHTWQVAHLVSSSALHAVCAYEPAPHTVQSWHWLAMMPLQSTVWNLPAAHGAPVTQRASFHRQQIKAAIEQRLREPGLSVASLATARCPIFPFRAQLITSRANGARGTGTRVGVRGDVSS
jgi:hypothetical protein